MPDPTYPIPLAAARTYPSDPIWEHYSMWADKLPGRPRTLAKVDARQRSTLTTPRTISGKAPSLEDMRKMREARQAELQAERDARHAANREKIMTGLDNAAPFLSNVVNSFRRAPRPVAPRPYQYTRLTPVNYNASRTEAERAVYGANRGVEALGENAAAAVRTANMTQGIRSVNQINEAEANQNAQISNQAAQMNTQIGNAYTDNLNRYDDMTVNAQMADMQQRSANLANAADKYIGIRNQMRLADLEGQKYGVLSKIYEDSGVLRRMVEGNRVDPRTGIPVMTPETKRLGGTLKYSAGGMLKRIQKVY